MNRTVSVILCKEKRYNGSGSFRVIIEDPTIALRLVSMHVSKWGCCFLMNESSLVLCCQVQSCPDCDRPNCMREGLNSAIGIKDIYFLLLKTALLALELYLVGNSHVRTSQESVPHLRSLL